MNGLISIITWLKLLSWLVNLPTAHTPQSAQFVGHRLIWMMLALCTLFWTVLVNDLFGGFLAWQKRPFPKTIHSFTPFAHASLAALPYRAYPLSCCLLN